MSTIADKLQDLVTAKEDMKSALVEKGVTPTGGLSTYADAIDTIENDDVELIPLCDGVRLANSSQIDFSMFDFSKVENFGGMFNNVRASGEIVLNNTIRKITNASGMFNYSTITRVPFLPTEHCKNMSYMFSNTLYMSSITPLDTRNCEDMSYMFKSSRINTIPLMDCGKVTTIYYMCQDCHAKIEGFKDLGKQPELDTVYAFANVPGISKQSILNIIDNLYDRASAGYSIVTITFAPGTKDPENDIELQNAMMEAANKGWTIAWY